MAFTANNNLTSNTPTNLRDWQHAARLFTDNQFRLAPKLDFQFHVAFSINKAALKNAELVQRYSNEINMLVKNVTLPKFAVSVDSVNQYNRKKNIQFHINAEDVTIAFHDDNMGLINQLWQNYYTYYYADPTSATQAGSYNRNATRSSDFITTPYGLDNKSTNPFFNYITIYQMARHEYTSIKLINPVIKSWNGNNLDYSKTTPHDFTMQLVYETVVYGNGAVSAGAPEGFGLEHYDVNPSPLQGINPDPTTIHPSFVDNLNSTSVAVSALNNAINTVNRYQNTQVPPQGGTVGLSRGVLPQTIGGVSGVVFPVATNSTNTTVATPTKLGA
jgi:hypothetical protein